METKSTLGGNPYGYFANRYGLTGYGDISAREHIWDLLTTELALFLVADAIWMAFDAHWGGWVNAGVFCTCFIVAVYAGRARRLALEKLKQHRAMLLESFGEDGEKLYRAKIEPYANERDREAIHHVLAIECFAATILLAIGGMMALHDEHPAGFWILILLAFPLTLAHHFRRWRDVDRRKADQLEKDAVKRICHVVGCQSLAY